MLIVTATQHGVEMDQVLRVYCQDGKSSAWSRLIVNERNKEYSKSKGARRDRGNLLVGKNTELRQRKNSWEF